MVPEPAWRIKSAVLFMFVCFAIADNARTLDKENLLLELEMLKMLKPHPNVVGLVGCCVEKGRNIFRWTTISPPPFFHHSFHLVVYLKYGC